MPRVSSCSQCQLHGSTPICNESAPGALAGAFLAPVTTARMRARGSCGDVWVCAARVRPSRVQRPWGLCIDRCYRCHSLCCVCGPCAAEYGSACVHSCATARPGPLGLGQFAVDCGTRHELARLALHRRLDEMLSARKLRSHVELTHCARAQCPTEFVAAERRRTLDLQPWKASPAAAHGPAPGAFGHQKVITS